MGNYLFYTSEGYTQAPNNEEVENCQMLGRASGHDKEEALQNLLDDNLWILSKGYSKEAIVACKIAE